MGSPSNPGSGTLIAKPFRQASETAPPELPLVTVSCGLCGASETAPFAEGFDYEYATASNRFTFRECLACGHLYLNPRPSASQLPVIYPSTYYAFAENQAGNSAVGYFRKIWESVKVKDFLKLIGPGRKKILDIGCGEGRFLSLLKQYGDPSWELVGLDLDKNAAELCRRKGFRCEVGRIEDFSGSEKFDAVILFQLIEHVDKPREVLESMRSCLNPGGVLILETPNPAGLDFKFFKKSYWGHYHFPRHWHLFTPSRMERLLSETGYCGVQSSSLLSPASWIISIHNLLLDKQYPKAIVDFFYFQNPILLAVFVLCDLSRKAAGFPTSNQRLTARVAA